MSTFSIRTLLNQVRIKGHILLSHRSVNVGFGVFHETRNVPGPQPPRRRHPKHSLGNKREAEQQETRVQEQCGRVAALELFAVRRARSRGAIY